MKDQPKFKKIINEAIPPKLYSYITVGRIIPLDKNLEGTQMKLIEYIFNLN